MKDYIIHREGKESAIGTVDVRVIDRSVSPAHADFITTLTPDASLKVRNHSPTGFEFGYGGSGPAQLALAILLDFTGKEPHPACYQAFKFFFIAPMGHPGGVIRGKDIEAWLNKWAAEEKGIYNE